MHPTPPSASTGGTLAPHASAGVMVAAKRADPRDSVGGFKLVLSKREDDRHASLEECPKGLDWAKAAGEM